MASAAAATDETQMAKNFHIFGCGISFSISPIIHNAGFQHYSLPHTYDIRESASIDDVSGLIASPAFGGGSVTMPHKLHVHKFCNEQTNTARLIGAVNTLVVKQSGNHRSITGDNTDWSGLYSIIETYSTGTTQKPRVGIVIGAGGAARAALYAMYRSGLQQIYVVNRTVAVAEKVKEDFASVFEVTVLPTLQDLPALPDIIIGTVPADTTTEDQFTSLFGSQGLCIDMSYKPRQTPLLITAQSHSNWTTVTGLEVLLAQAYDQFRLWTGQEPPKEKMKEAVRLHELEKERKTREGML